MCLLSPSKTLSIAVLTHLLEYNGQATVFIKFWEDAFATLATDERSCQICSGVFSNSGSALPFRLTATYIITYTLSMHWYIHHASTDVR